MSDVLDSPGVRIGNETLTTIRADERIRPLRDVLIVEPIDFQPSKIIRLVHSVKPLRGIVRVAGPGRYPIKYNGPKGKRTKSWESKHFRPTQVRVGDVIELGGLELGGYLFQTILWGGKEHVICREEDVAIVVEEAA